MPEKRLPYTETVEPRSKAEYVMVGGDSFRRKLKSSSD